MPKLTKRVVDAAKRGTSDYFVWDGDLPGFGLRVFPSGKKSYLVQYRSTGRTRRITIGLHGPFTPDKARGEAMRILATIAKGGDPAEEKSNSRCDVTVSELCELYLAEGCASKKPSTLLTDRGRIDRHIKPLLGKRLVRSVTAGDIEKFVNDVAEGKSATDIKTKTRGRAIVKGGGGTAARTVGLLGGIFTFAIKAKKLRLDNPVHGAERRKDIRRSRFLSVAEFARLGVALARAEKEALSPNAAAAIRLLILTGCRRSEILSLQWHFVDWERRQLHLPDSKTGQKTVQLPTPAIDLLKSLPRVNGSPYVLPGANKDKPYAGLQKVWQTIRTWADLDDVRIHDLRRSFASTAALNGQSLLMIGKLLGHADPKTTQIYAHLADDALAVAANETAERIVVAMGIQSANAD